MDSGDENNNRIVKYRDELILTFHKSQETFEKQFSYICAGTLSLSVIFIDTIVKKFGESKNKFLIGIGWVLLIVALLINLISHLKSAQFTNQAIKEINENNYDQLQIEKRHRKIVRLNYYSVSNLIIGIFFIMLFIFLNVIL
jgi:hypothetical protein